MVEPAHHRLSISAQCRLLRISRSSYYYAPVPETDETLALMTVIDTTFLDCPWYGIPQSPDGLRNPRETKAFAIENRAGKWSITTVQMGNNFAHTVPREFGN